MWCKEFLHDFVALTDIILAPMTCKEMSMAETNISEDKSRLTVISKKMEEGWKLLNQSCPMEGCGTPLLEDKERKIYCAGCRMYCLKPEDVHMLSIASDSVITEAQGTTGLGLSTGGLSTGGSSTGGSSAGGSSIGQVPLSKDAPSCELRRLITSSSRKALRGADRTKAEERMAEKLLLGWTMLSDVCPTSGCLFPLMLDGNGDTTCVACGNDCVKTHDEAEGSQRQVDNPTGATTAKTAPSDVVNVSRSCSDGVLSEEKFAALRDQRDKVSATIGRMMLQGWCLLNDICSRPECESSPPLLLDKRTGTLYCTACDKYEEVASPSKSTSSAQAALPVKRSSDGEEQSPLKEEVTPTADLEPAEGENEYESAERTRLRKQAMRQRNGGSVGASASLAERLLQGWAMLSTACPTAGCHNPLMRDRTGTILCVSCGEATAAPGKSPAPGESPAPVERKGGSMDDEKEDRGMVDDSTAKRIYARHRLNERGDYVPADSTAVAIAKSVSETSTLDRARITTQTLDTLYRALEASQQRLDSCTRAAPVDVHESARQADLIAKLAHAAKALNDLLT